MLDKVYTYYAERVTTAINRLTVLFEPVMLIVMGVVVGILIISMYLPIFNLASTIKG